MQESNEMTLRECIVHYLFKMGTSVDSSTLCSDVSCMYGKKPSSVRSTLTDMSRKGDLFRSKTAGVFTYSLHPFEEGAEEPEGQSLQESSIDVELRDRLAAHMEKRSDALPAIAAVSPYWSVPMLYSFMKNHESIVMDDILRGSLSQILHLHESGILLIDSKDSSMLFGTKGSSSGKPDMDSDSVSGLIEAIEVLAEQAFTVKPPSSMSQIDRAFFYLGVISSR